MRKRTYNFFYFFLGLDAKRNLILYSQNSRTADKSGLKLETSEVTGPPSELICGKGGGVVVVMKKELLRIWTN